MANQNVGGAVLGGHLKLVASNFSLSFELEDSGRTTSPVASR